MGIIRPNVSGATLHDLQLHLTVRVGWGGVGIIPNVSGLQLHLMVRVGWGGVGIIPNVSGATIHDLQLRLMVRVGWGGDNTKRVWRYAT